MILLDFKIFALQSVKLVSSNCNSWAWRVPARLMQEKPREKSVPPVSLTRDLLFVPLLGSIHISCVFAAWRRLISFTFLIGQNKHTSSCRVSSKGPHMFLEQLFSKVFLFPWSGLGIENRSRNMRTWRSNTEVIIDVFDILAKPPKILYHISLCFLPQDLQNLFYNYFQVPLAITH